MELIWHGTASVEAVCGEGRILFDPFVPLKKSPVDVKISEFDGFSDIFVTHCHFDHVADLPKVVKRNPDAVIHCTEITYKTLRRIRIPEKNLDLCRLGDVKHINGFTVKLMHGKHAVLPKFNMGYLFDWIRSPAWWNIPPMYVKYVFFRENDETVFYQIEADGKTVQLMGSMNLRDEADYPTGADLLVLPYNGWADNLPPAKMTIERLEPKRVVLDHYDDTFPPLTTPLDLTPVLREYEGMLTAMELRKPETV